MNVKDLSKVLEIKMPAETSMMKKFAAKGLVHYESYRPLSLTAKGKKEAGLVISWHRLREMYQAGISKRFTYEPVKFGSFFLCRSSPSGESINYDSWAPK